MQDSGACLITRERVGVLISGDSANSSANRLKTFRKSKDGSNCVAQASISHSTSNARALDMTTQRLRSPRPNLASPALPATGTAATLGDPHGLEGPPPASRRALLLLGAVAVVWGLAAAAAVATRSGPLFLTRPPISSRYAASPPSGVPIRMHWQQAGAGGNADAGVAAPTLPLTCTHCTQAPRRRVLRVPIGSRSHRRLRPEPGPRGLERRLGLGALYRHHPHALRDLRCRHPRPPLAMGP